MTDILSVQSIQLDLVTKDGTSYWIATAMVDGMHQTLGACYNPPGSAHPSEHGPALCCATFQLDDGEQPPPIDGTQLEQIEFLDSLYLTWELDDE